MDKCANARWKMRNYLLGVIRIFDRNEFSVLDYCSCYFSWNRIGFLFHSQSQLVDERKKKLEIEIFVHSIS